MHDDLIYQEFLPLLVGKQIGRIKSVIGTRSFNRNSAISLSKLLKLNFWAIARKTNRDSGLTESLHRSCSPNVTLIINHIKLKKKNNIIKLDLTCDLDFKKFFHLLIFLIFWGQYPINFFVYAKILILGPSSFWFC